MLRVLQTKWTTRSSPAWAGTRRYFRLECSQVVRRHACLSSGRTLFYSAREGLYGSSKRSLVTATAVQTSTRLDGQTNDITTSRSVSENLNVLVMDVTKMMCGGCSASVKKILLQHPSVEGASVNLITGTAVVNMRPGSTEIDEDNVVETVTAKGFPSFKRSSEGVSDQTEKIKLEQEKDEIREYVSLIVLPTILIDLQKY